MELIDREKLLKTIPSEEIVARMAIMSAPVVDAIPIEWIEKYVESCHGMFKKDMRWIEIMVSWWKAEQEKQNGTAD